MKKLVVVPFVVGILSGCNSDNDINLPQTPSGTITIEAIFTDDKHGWDSGFSDFPPGDEDGLELTNEVRDVPDKEDLKGYLLASHNRSDDIFMYLKRHVTGLKAGADYTLSGEFTIYSNAAIGCFGAGGSPGEALYMKVGATEIEPEQVDYHMNIDIGDQSESGNDAIVIGNAGTEGPECVPGNTDIYGTKTIQFGGETAFKFTASDDGDIWVVLGTDSGYEGYTEIFYTEISLKLAPES